MEPLARSRHALRRRPQDADRQADAGGERGLLPPPHAAGADRHPARRAHGAAEGEGRHADVDVERLHRHPLAAQRALDRTRACEPRLLRRVRVPEPGGRSTSARAAARRLDKGEPGEQTMTFTPGGRRRRSGRARLRGPRRQGAGARRSLRWRQGGESFFPSSERDADRPLARVRRLPRRRHRLAPARRARRATASTFTISDLGSLNGTFVNTQADRVGRASRTTTSSRSASTA